MRRGPEPRAGEVWRAVASRWADYLPPDGVPSATLLVLERLDGSNFGSVRALWLDGEGTGYDAGDEETVLVYVLHEWYERVEL